MTDDECLEVTGPHVISETIEGESVVIDLESGIYYSLGGTASEIWESIVATTSRSTLVTALCARYAGAPEAVDAAVLAFLQELEDDGLIKRTRAPAAVAATVPEPPADGRSDFEPPTVERFTDIQDLLMLDPIHEVDPAGWPRRGPDA